MLNSKCFFGYTTDQDQVVRTQHSYVVQRVTDACFMAVLFYTTLKGQVDLTNLMMFEISIPDILKPHKASYSLQIIV